MPSESYDPHTTVPQNIPPLLSSRDCNGSIPSSPKRQKNGFHAALLFFSKRLIPIPIGQASVPPSPVSSHSHLRRKSHKKIHPWKGKKGGAAQTSNHDVRGFFSGAVSQRNLARFFSLIPALCFLCTRIPLLTLRIRVYLSPSAKSQTHRARNTCTQASKKKKKKKDNLGKTTRYTEQISPKCDSPPYWLPICSTIMEWPSPIR
ncbi:hypothetical protein V8C35DRAFT_74828 [Trichoderma chlorosporum]